MKNIILIRHGSLEPIYDGRYIGATDAELTEHGIKQMISIGKLLDEAARQVVYASPRSRVRQSVKAAGLDALSVNWDDRLREISFGQCEALTYAEILEKFPALKEEWRPDNYEFTFPDGDKVMDFRARVLSVLNEILEHDDKLVTIFTHGGVINTILEFLLKIPTNDIWRYAPGRGSMSVVRISDHNHVSLQLLNHRPYLFERGTPPWQ